MYAIASMLDVESDSITRELWDWIQSVCGMLEIKSSPIPHFSWLIGEEPDLAQIETALRKISTITEPFQVQVSGIGIFTGTNLVMYLGLNKTKQMLQLHSYIWNHLSINKTGSGMFYHPNEWIPHITLAYRDTDHERLACAIDGLAFDFQTLQITINQIGVIYQNLDEYGIAMNFVLAGKE
jgi:hypothetical protein